MDIKTALKSAINASDTYSKTQGGTGNNALNNTDLVQLYDNAGNPNGKITKSALMDAVKASLPALLADQTTTGVNFPSINSSGILGKMTAANLASVLGERKQFAGNIDELLNDGHYYVINKQATGTIPTKNDLGTTEQISNYTIDVTSVPNQNMKRQTINDFNTRMILERWKLGNNSWGNWEIIYTDTMLSNSKQMGLLASALEVFKYKTNSTVNVDDFTEGIVYVNGVGSGTWPFSTTYAYGSILLAVSRNDGLRVAQLVFRNGYGIWYRVKSEDTWGAWAKISNL